MRARARVGLGLALRILEEDALAGLGVGALEALPALDALQIGLRDLAVLAPLGHLGGLPGVLLLRFLLLDLALLEVGVALRQGLRGGRRAGRGLEEAPGAVELRSFCSVVPSGQDWAYSTLPPFETHLST